MGYIMKTVKRKTYNHSGNVVNGNLCKKCSNDKTCADKRCPLWQYRKG